jgi:hypothetical protein
MSSGTRVAGSSGTDVFPAGTYKISDKTMHRNGTPLKIAAIEIQTAGAVTSGKYYDNAGDEQSLTAEYLTNSLIVGTLVTFQFPLHELVLASSATVIFV